MYEINTLLTGWSFNWIPPVPGCFKHLQFNTVDYAPEHQTAGTACRYSSISSLNGISQNSTLCEAEQRRIYKCI